MDRHFTVSVYAVHNNKVLLHKHKKARILLPVGGHIDRNELPEEAAIRETLEGAGIDVALYDVDKSKYATVNTERERVLVNPMHTVLGEVEKGHEYINFVFYAKSVSDKLSPGENESTRLAWYSESDLDQIKDELLEDVYLMAKEAIGVYKELS